MINIVFDPGTLAVSQTVVIGTFALIGVAASITTVAKSILKVAKKIAPSSTKTQFAK